MVKKNIPMRIGAWEIQFANNIGCTCSHFCKVIVTAEKVIEGKGKKSGCCITTRKKTGTS